MPYIDKSNRKYFDSKIYDLSLEIYTAGDLNYCISSLCAIKLDGNLSYAKINEMIGVLECAKQELYRRVAAPYEDIKCKQNGDVYYDV